MAFVRCVCFFAAVLLSRIIADTDAARLKRQSSENFQVPFLQQLQDWADQSSSQTLHRDAVDPNNLMEPMVSQVLLPSNRRVTGQTAQDNAMVLNSLMEQVNQGIVPENQELTLKHVQEVPPNLDADSLRRLVNSVQQQTGKDRIELRLTDGDRNDPNSPAVSVVVETLTVEDLLTSDEGKQQLGQLNAQLEQAMSSLSQSVQMMQGPDQVETMIDNFSNVSADTMLGGLVSMLGGGHRDDVYLGILGSQSLQAVNQFTQVLDQLPGLKFLLGKLYRFVGDLHTQHSSTVKGVQQLFINAVMSFKGMNAGMGQDGLMTEMDAMLEMGLKALTANLEFFEFMINEIQQTSKDPSFVLAMNDTQCVVKSLKGDLSTNTAVGCLQHLMQALALVNQSEHTIASLINSINHLLDRPGVLQGLTDLIKTPRLDRVFDMIKMMTGDLNEANKDVVKAIQTLQTMLQNLLKNKPFLEILGNFVQSPESIQVYENAMRFLQDAALGDPATQQLLQVVNDSITMLWREGNPQNVADKIQEILAMLKNNQQSTPPLNEPQQALLDLLNKLLKVVQNAINSEMNTTQTSTPTIPTTVTSINSDVPITMARTTTMAPPVTTRASLETSSQNSHSPKTDWTTRLPSEPSTTTSGNGGEFSRSPNTTRNPNTNDDNGSALASVSAFTLIIALLASTL